MQRVDAEAEAMRQQGQAATLVEDSQIVPECRLIAKRQISLPFRMTLVDQLGHHAVLEIGHLPRVFLFQRSILGEQLGVSCTFVIRHWRRIAGQGPQAVAVAVGQVKRDLDPLPTSTATVSASALSYSVTSRSNRAGSSSQPPASPWNRSMQHRAARCFIGLNAHKDRASVRRPDRGFGQHALDLEWLLIPG
jgi:hypothetical protein